MTPSASCVAFIKGYETCARARRDGRFDAFLPTPDDVATIGWGTTGPDIRLGLIWTKQQCDARFATDLARFAAQVSALIGHVTTTQAQFDAMVSLAYNIGIRNFGTSAVLTNHLAGHQQTASLAFPLWNKQRSKKTGQLVELRGLTARRVAEAQIYKGAQAA